MLNFTRTLRLRHRWIAAPIPLLLALLIGCGGASTPGGAAAPAKSLKRPAARSSAGYVGSAACAACHAEIASHYAQHPMAISVHKVADLPVENYEQTKFSPAASRKYFVERDGETVLHHEQGIDAAGEMVYDQAVPVRYAIGSGRRGRSYLIDRDGLLFLSPISWYSSSKKWDLSPQYTAHGSFRFDRPAYDRCLHCHAGQMHYDSPPDSELVQRYTEPIFEEMAIGCERCHGPGREHIAYRRASKSGRGASAGRREGADPIVEPSRLSPAKRDAVCNQCHLHGEAMVLRYGRTHSDFRPGDHLGDIWSAFVAGEGVDESNETRAVSQGEQMLASQCYRQSSGKLGCTSCHDPHQMPPEDSKVSYFDGRCVNCHEKQGCSLPRPKQMEAPAHGSCIACHMPRLEANDIPHTTQTDHRILRRPLERPPSASEDDALKPENYSIFDEQLCPLPPLEKDRARGLMLGQVAEILADAELAAKVEKLLTPVTAAAPDDVDVIDMLGAATSLQGRMADAARYWRSAATIEPRRQKPIFSLAVLAQSEGNLPTALVYEERLLELNPWHAVDYLRHSRTLSALGRNDDALQAAEMSISLDPSSAASHDWVAQLYHIKGELAKADAARRKAQRLTPPRPPPTDAPAE